MISKENNCTSVRGFTIVELMAVVVIIVLISSVSIVAINRARNRTRDAIITSSLEQLIAVGETVHSPTEEYKEFYYMRENKNHRIEEIRDRINDMGSDRVFNLWFPEDSPFEETSGYNEYCAYVQLFGNPNKVFCVDSDGFRGEVEVDKNNQINCQSSDYSPYNCQYD